MKMLLLSVSLLLAINVTADAGTATSRVEYAGLFKNGLVLIRQTYALPGPGSHAFAEVPAAVHGTLWIESDPGIAVRTGLRDVATPADGEVDLSPGASLLGQRVVVAFRTEHPRVTGILRGAPGATREARSPRETHHLMGAIAGPAFYVLDLDEGRIFIEPTTVASISSEGALPEGSQTVSQPVLTIDVPEEHAGPASVTATYLTRGVSWAPGYRIDITDPKQLKIEQSAVIRNELADLEDVAFELISGFPSVEFAHVTSPLATAATWETFFQQLQRSSGASGSVLGQQSAFSNNVLVMHDPALDTSVPPVAEGADLYYHAIGKRTLGQDEAMSLNLAAASAPYEPVVEWTVPARRENNRGNHDGWGNPGSASPEGEDLWDALRFRNPFDFPMTTAPALVVSQGRFLGSRTSRWVNPGGETLAYVTKALSVQVSAKETEVGEREEMHMGRARYTQSTVDGELSVHNLRDKAINLIVRKELSGSLVSADNDPEQEVGERGPGQLNPSTRLTWTVEVPAGGELLLNYRYHYLVR